MNVFDEFSALAKVLHAHQAEYCLIGGVALAFHSLPRYTKDIDLLVTPDGLPGVVKAMEQAGYFKSTQPWTFNSTKLTLHRYMKTEGSDFLLIDVLVAGEARHFDIIKAALMIEHKDFTVPLATKPDLIWLKSKRNSKQDQADIEGLTNENA